MNMKLTNHIQIPKLGINAHFVDRHLMSYGHPSRRFKLTSSFPPVVLPIDWTKGNSLNFPIDGNDQYGDCLYAAPCHMDNTWTGNVGIESTFNESTIISDYLKLSGGDHGLNEQLIIPEWKKGLASNPTATILDAMDVDPTNQQLCHSAIYLFGGIIFMLDVPTAWINNFNTGYIWDVPTQANRNNGHATLWNGVESNGNYKVQTWGTYGYITPAGVEVCNPTGFIVFSMRWFNAQGIAPNGMHYSQLSELWTEAGGIGLPPSPFPPTPIPVPPVPPVPPVSIPDVGIYTHNKTIHAPGYTLNNGSFDQHKISIMLQGKVIITPKDWLPI